MIDKQILINWLHNQIDMELSCVEDLELTEGIKNEYGRGRISAWEMMLDGLKHFEKQTINNTVVEKLKSLNTNDIDEMVKALGMGGKAFGKTFMEWYEIEKKRS